MGVPASATYSHGTLRVNIPYHADRAGQKSGRLQKFSPPARRQILYFDSFAAADTVKLSSRLRAKYPIRAQTFPSEVHEYYEPEVNSVARPVQLEVRPH